MKNVVILIFGKIRQKEEIIFLKTITRVHVISETNTVSGGNKITELSNTRISERAICSNALYQHNVVLGDEKTVCRQLEALETGIRCVIRIDLTAIDIYTLSCLTNQSQIDEQHHLSSSVVWSMGVVVYLANQPRFGFHGLLSCASNIYYYFELPYTYSKYWLLFEVFLICYIILVFDIIFVEQRNIP